MTDFLFMEELESDLRDEYLMNKYDSYSFYDYSEKYERDDEYYEFCDSIYDKI